MWYWIYVRIYILYIIQLYVCTPLYTYSFMHDVQFGINIHAYLLLYCYCWWLHCMYMRTAYTVLGFHFQGYISIGLEERLKFLRHSHKRHQKECPSLIDGEAAPLQSGNLNQWCLRFQQLVLAWKEKMTHLIKKCWKTQELVQAGTLCWCMVYLYCMCRGTVYRYNMQFCNDIRDLMIIIIEYIACMHNTMVLH